MKSIWNRRSEQETKFAAKNRCEGFDPTGYFFPGYPERPADSYVDGLKKRAADLGVGISGTGVRNNFTTADFLTQPPVRYFIGRVNVTF